MEFDGIPIPNKIRSLVKGVAWNGIKIGDNHYSFKKPEEILDKLDVLTKTAHKKLIDFCSVTSGRDQEQTQGWSKIREYKAEGSAFLFATDPIAPDSIVVKKYIRQSTEDSREVFWVATEREDKLGIPFLYQIDPEVFERDGIAYFWTTTINTIKPDMARHECQTLFEAGNNSPGNDIVIEVWKQGKTVANKRLKKSATTKSRQIGQQVPGGVLGETN